MFTHMEKIECFAKARAGQLRLRKDQSFFKRLIQLCLDVGIDLCLLDVVRSTPFNEIEKSRESSYGWKADGNDDVRTNSHPD